MNLSKFLNKIFGINLIAHLCDKYPIVRTFNVAKLAINVIFTVLQGNIWSFDFTDSNLN